MAATRVSLFHPQTKTNVADEFPKDELPPEDELPPRRRITPPKTNSPKTNCPPEDEFLPEDEFPEDELFPKYTSVPKTNSPKTTCMPPEDEFPEDELLFPEDQTRQRSVAIENVRWGLHTCPRCLPRQRFCKLMASTMRGAKA